MSSTEEQEQFVDHKQLAEEYLDKALNPEATLSPHTPLELAAIAQAQATLYLAEQQRIANLIAAELLGANSSFNERVAYFIKKEPEIARLLGLE